MQSYLYYFFAAGLLLLSAGFCIWAWDRFSHKKSGGPGDGEPEGAFRAFYHALWILIFWSALALSVPLWLSFRTHVAGAESADRVIAVAKALSSLLFLISVFYYGKKKGYLSWIESLQWPDKENKR